MKPCAGPKQARQTVNSLSIKTNFEIPTEICRYKIEYIFYKLRLLQKLRHCNNSAELTRFAKISCIGRPSQAVKAV